MTFTDTTGQNDAFVFNISKKLSLNLFPTGWQAYYTPPLPTVPLGSCHRFKRNGFNKLQSQQRQQQWARWLCAANSREEKQANVANYDPPRCPALKRQGPLPLSLEQKKDQGLSVRIPQPARWTPCGQFPCNVASSNRCSLGQLPTFITTLSETKSDGALGRNYPERSLI